VNKHLEMDTPVIDVMTTEETSRLAELEALVDQQKTNVEQAGLQTGYALREINEKRLYRTWQGTPEHPTEEGKTATFEQYVLGRHGWTRTTAYRLINWATITDQMLPEGYKPSRAESRVLEALKPEQIQVVAKVAQAITGSKKLDTAQIKAVAEVVVALDQAAVVEDPDSGQQVPLSELTPERRVAIIAENVSTSTFERVKRQENHIQERQQKKNPSSPTTASSGGEEPSGGLRITYTDTLMNMTQDLGDHQCIAILVYRDASNNPQAKGVLIPDMRKLKPLYEGENKPWFKPAVLDFIDLMKNGRTGGDSDD
jgi:hypothetical protein